MSYTPFKMNNQWVTETEPKRKPCGCIDHPGIYLGKFRPIYCEEHQKEISDQRSEVLRARMLRRGKK